MKALPPRRILTPLLSALILAFAGLAAAQNAVPEKKPAAKPMKSKAAAEHVAMAPSDMKWGDAPPSLPKGAKLAVLEGDPSKAGAFTIRLQVPDGYKVMPHWHPMTEHLTVISGEFHVATGDTFDDTKGKELPAGGFLIMPAKMHHFAWAKGETVIQLHGMGPFKLIYVNAADDPSGMQGKAKHKTAKKAPAKS